MNRYADVAVRSIGRWLALVCLALVLGGCGSSKPTAYGVTGTITFASAPVEEGSVLFEDPSTGIAKQVDLSAGGKYALELPPGSYQVSVTPPLGDASSRGDTPADADYQAVPNIPRRYWFNRTSGFAAEISEDSTAHDFDMKK